jgi:hypothetical protein
MTIDTVFVSANVFKAVQLWQKQSLKLLRSSKDHGHTDYIFEADIAPGFEVGHGIGPDTGATGHIGLRHLLSQPLNAQTLAESLYDLTGFTEA